MRSSSSNSRATGAVLASEGTSTSGVAAAHLSGKPGVVGGPSTGAEPTCEKQAMPVEAGAAGKDAASDEELARRLHAQLNGEALALAVRRRTRKQPSFYTPQQGSGYSGYHGAEFVNIEADHEHAARPPQQQGDVCMSDGEVKSGSAVKRALRGAPTQEPDAKRLHVMGASPDGSVKQEEEQGTGSHSGVNGRELRALTRSAQGVPRGDSPQPEGCSGSAKGSGGRGNESCAGSGSGRLSMDVDEGSEGTEQARGAARAAKRQRSNLGQPAPKEEVIVKGSDSDRHLSTLPSSSTMDVDSHSDDGHNSNGARAPTGKLRKIPKLPMVRHGKKWYRARLLRDTGSRVTIEFTGFEEQSGPLALPRDSDRIWRGSYKGKDWRYLGDGAWEPKEKQCKKPQHQHSGHKTASQPTSRHSHSAADAPQSSDPSSEDGPADNEDDHAIEGDSVQPAKAVRSCPALEAHGSSALKETDSVKAGRGRKAKVDKAPQPAELKVEADAVKLDPTSVITDPNLCSGAVKPHTPAKGVESKPAPGDAGTDSGEDDDAKVAAGAAERPQATAAEEAAPASRRKAAAGNDLKAEEDLADKAAAAVLTGMGSSDGDEGDDTRLQCEEALPVEEAAAGRADAAAAGSPTQPSPQARPQHLGWKGAWKQSHKKQLEGGSNSDSDKPPIPPAEPTLSPKSLRPARRTRKPLKIDNPYDDTASLRSLPPPTSPLASMPSPSPFNSPPDSEDDKDPEPPAAPTIVRRGGGGRRGGRGFAGRGGRGRGGGRWARHRAAQAAAAAALNVSEDSGGADLHDAGSGVPSALAHRPVRTVKPSSKVLAATSSHSPPPPTRRGRSASTGMQPFPACRSLAAFSSLMEAMGNLAARGNSSRAQEEASLPWAAAKPASVPSPLSSWPPSSAAAHSPGRSPLFGMPDLNALWRFAAHRKILEASEKLCSSQALLGWAEGPSRVPPVPLFQ
ncbi:hypothetical protein COCOBI_07-4260 [Coccomyxa sp. Obi]|nr:hypothetical protein COCOBI_07-4260 [Coccomyxa sp. Obi]